MKRQFILFVRIAVLIALPEVASFPASLSLNSIFQLQKNWPGTEAIPEVALQKAKYNLLCAERKIVLHACLVASAYSTDLLKFRCLSSYIIRCEIKIRSTRLNYANYKCPIILNYTCC